MLRVHCRLGIRQAAIGAPPAEADGAAELAVSAGRMLSGGQPHHSAVTQSGRCAAAGRTKSYRHMSTGMSLFSSTCRVTPPRINCRSREWL